MGRLERLAPLSGVAVVLFIAEAVVTGDTPTTDAPAQEVVAYWRDNGRVQETGALLFALAAIAFVSFGAALSPPIGCPRRGEARDDRTFRHGLHRGRARGVCDLRAGRRPFSG
jgi:hypothetical protein